MHVEIQVALNFVIAYLFNKLPRLRVNMFGQAIEKGLKKKFQDHWYPEKPTKGSGFRCVRMNGEKLDPIISMAANESGLNLDEIKGHLPDELTLWIDPSEVSYRITEKGPVKILYSDRKDDELIDTYDREIQAVSKRFNPDAQSFKPIDSLSSSHGSLNLSPSSPTASIGWTGSMSPSVIPPISWSESTSPSIGLDQSPSPVQTVRPGKQWHTQFTAASFAQTKFGSTKLKTQAKRPTRLSPTEFGNYFRQRSMGAQQPGMNYMNPLPPQRPRSLSPRDPRTEFWLDQQQRYFLPATQTSPQQHLSPQGPAIGELYVPHLPSPSEPMGASMGVADSPQGAATLSSMLSPDGQNSLTDGFNLNSVPYTNQYHHMLMAS